MTIKFTDKRAGSKARENGEGTVDHTDLRDDGSLRRSAGGGRTFADYFSGENRHKAMMRGELLGILELLAWHRREATWYRRLWRLVTRQPGPRDLWPQMARGYVATQLAPAIAAAEAELRRRQGQGAPDVPRDTP